MIKFVQLILLILLSTQCFAGKYWLFLPEEHNKYSRYQTYQKTEDFKQEFSVLTGTTIHYYSFLLNALSVSVTVDQLKELKFSGCFKKIVSVKRLKTLHNASNSFELASIAQALRQMNAEALIEEGLTGKGVKIGIVDGGFRNAEKSPWLKHIFKSGRVKACQNFLNNSNECFDKTIDDDHGTNVWEAIAGISNGEQIGMATNSTFYLAHTDHPKAENKVEEDNWIAAIEWFYENDVRLVNSSLGYSTGFDDPKENYQPKDINGQSVLTLAANEAAKKGMIIVSAAGNDGINSFKVVSIPADAKGLITVGASTYKYRKKASYSSAGSPHLPYLKPDISTFSGSGTSFSAPAITGIIACLLERDPDLSSDSIKSILIRSSHLYPYGNNYLGFGIPDVKKILNNHQIPAEKIVVDGLTFTFQGNAPFLTIFHKSDAHKVEEQEVIKVKNGQAVISKPRNCRKSTVWYNKNILEIVWK